MLKVYNSNYEFLGLLDTSLKDVYTTETLSTGLKTLCFKAPVKDEYIDFLQEENYIETADYSYIIKEVNYQDNTFMTVYCNANIENITGSIFLVFDCFDKNIAQGYEYCLQHSAGWTINYHSMDQSIITYQTTTVSAYEMITQIAYDYNQELWFDTKNKVLHIYDKMGVNRGVWVSNELRLKKLIKQSSTYDYATVLYPFGKDGLTVASVNNGRQYIENFTYSSKYISKIWKNDEITIPEKLLEAAENYLNEIAVPRASYKVSLNELGTDISIGDDITIIDKLKKIKQVQRVVKICRYPFAPEKDTVEISNLQEDFAKTWVKNQKKLQHDIEYIKGVIAALA